MGREPLRLENNGGKRPIVVILGMHRTGTSLLANLLNALGIYFGDSGSLLAADKWNMKGYWEIRDIFQTQDKVLELLGRPWDSISGTLPFPSRWWEMPEIEPHRRRLTEVLQTQIDETRGIFAFKDPRTAHLLPLWEEVFHDLEVDPLYLLAIRHPLAVAMSMVKRNGIPSTHAQLLWLKTYLDALRYAPHGIKAVVEYDRWFTHAREQTVTLINALDLAPASASEADIDRLVSQSGEAISTDLRHHTPDQIDGGEYLPFVEEAYSLLTEAARTGELPPGLSRIQAAYRDAQKLYMPAVAEGERERVNLDEALKGLSRRKASEVSVAEEPATLEEVHFPRLPIAPGVNRHRLPRVCIASQEFVRLHRNGGIGTAYTSLGEALARAGHEVTFLYTRSQHCETGTFESVGEHYLQKGIRLEAVPGDIAEDGTATTGMPHVSYRTYRWLKDRRFDIVHFPEMGGIGYYTLLAKRQGLAFKDTLLCVGTHSPTLWLNHANNQNINESWQLEADFIERLSVELADVVWSPSQYMLNWIRSQGWRLPEACYVQPYITSMEARSREPDRDGVVHPVGEIVFFGRLETRKGLAVFCDALDELVDGPRQPSAVTFLGRHGIVFGRESWGYIEERSSAWPWPTRVIDNYDQPRAIEYLRGENRLALMASPVDNSPNTVYECLGERIPFIACRSGGIPELISEQDAESVTFEYDGRALASLLTKVLSEGIRVARPAVEIMPNEQAWASWHEQLVEDQRIEMQPEGAASGEALQLVTVCLREPESHSALCETLTSIARQDYPFVEVVLALGIDELGAPVPPPPEVAPFLERPNWRATHSLISNRGQALNEAARNARGEYLLFVGDSSAMEPEGISTLVHAARRSGADILTCPEEFVRNPAEEDPAEEIPDLALPLGAAPLPGLFRNCLGTSSALVRRDVFTAQGGYVEDVADFENWEFFARSMLAGYRLEVVPETLFRTSRKEAIMLSVPIDLYRQCRILQPYMKYVPKALKDLVLIAHGMESGTSSVDTRKITEYYEERIRLSEMLARGKLLAELRQTGEAGATMRAIFHEARQSTNVALRLDMLMESGRVLIDLGDVVLGRQALAEAFDAARRMNQRSLAANLKMMVETLDAKMGFAVRH